MTDSCSVVIAKRLEGFGHELIRDRIVLRIRDDKVRAKLLREKKLTLESAQEIVLTSEVTKFKVSRML